MDELVPLPDGSGSGPLTLRQAIDRALAAADINPEHEKAAIEITGDLQGAHIVGAWRIAKHWQLKGAVDFDGRFTGRVMVRGSWK